VSRRRWPAGEILSGLWRFEQVHPEWTREDGGADGWEAEVAWWAITTPAGLVLVDPLVHDWDPLDDLVARHGRCAAVVRTTYWHQRTIPEAAARYDAAVWAMPPPIPAPPRPFDRAVVHGQALPGDLIAFSVGRLDEIVIWLPQHAALLFGDVVLRGEDGRLRLCPDSWLAPDGGPQRVRAALAALPDLQVEHVLVSHGPPVLGDGWSSLRQSLASDQTT
jgi:hypothetical protein